MSWHDRVFRTLMRVLPAEFRGDYEREMAATFRAERRSAGGAASLTRVWLATIADVFRTAPSEHIDILRRDLAYTFRMLARRPVLTFTAVLTLALGIGANTAIFSVVNGVLLAPLDYRNTDQLLFIEEQVAGREPGMTGYPTYADLRSENVTIESSAALSGFSATLTGGGATPSVSMVRGSPGSTSGRSVSRLRSDATLSNPKISPGLRPWRSSAIRSGDGVSMRIRTSSEDRSR